VIGYALTVRSSSLGVGESEWVFKTSFSVTEKELRSKQVDLVFDGLDTFVKVNLVCSKIPSFLTNVMTVYSFSEREIDSRVWGGIVLLFFKALTLDFFLRSSNQFVSHRIPVKENLKAGVNDLVLHFENAFGKVNTSSKHGVSENIP
jgi:beta-mannosidase